MTYRIFSYKRFELRVFSVLNKFWKSNRIKVKSTNKTHSKNEKNTIGYRIKKALTLQKKVGASLKNTYEKKLKSYFLSNI